MGAPEGHRRSEVQGPRPLTLHPPYDELAVRRRLAVLDRNRKALFAALCTEHLWPLYERYAAAVGRNPADLAPIVDRLWAALAGEPVDPTFDLPVVQQQLLDEDAPGWTVGSAYVDDATASLVYAIETWRTDDAQNAAWSARRLHDAADHAVQAALNAEIRNGVGDGADTEARRFAHPITQTAIGFIADALQAAESSPPLDWPALRQSARLKAHTWSPTTERRPAIS
ncbi:hypothetical protein ACQPXM_18820 [Kribbella sp. CA-253562]|uniref:hypothetical protein n=1 Tax=Kribbella sp. CA-253562 TaxID=3239942 RepID=UPI003D943ECC